MSAIKKYLKEEIQLKGLEHIKPPEFYLSPWQETRSSVPLLIFRIFLFLGILAIVLASMIYFIHRGLYRFWFIYLTNWGLMTILLATGFGTAVSARCYFYGPISAEFCLPWYVKTFWVLYNISIPIGFLITLFYWSVLHKPGIKETMNQVHDVAIHALNSVILFLLLMTSKHPSRLLHVHHPIIFIFIYLIFNVIYLQAGGTNLAGLPWIYPILNWRKPGTTIGVCVLVILLLTILHLIIVGLAVARDRFASRFLQKAKPNEQPNEQVLLRQQQA